MATTTTMRLRSAIGPQRTGETIPLTHPEPIYHELVQEWQNAGRPVPGRDDEEGDALTSPLSDLAP
ncbi:hypothetical protein [Streptomyces cinereoruber]|uniref:hypothetical protein n=1 Tax=Streptomyces cinereoruber TaxID=67260 RepID=UPI00363ED9A2